MSSVFHQVVVIPKKNAQDMLSGLGQNGPLHTKIENKKAAVTAKGLGPTAVEAFKNAAFPEGGAVYVSGPTLEKGSVWLVGFFRNAGDAHAAATRLEPQTTTFQGIQESAVKVTRNAPFIALTPRKD